MLTGRSGHWELGVWQHRDHGGPREQIDPVETAPGWVHVGEGEELRHSSQGRAPRNERGEDSPGLWLHSCDPLQSGLMTASERSWWLQSHALPQRARALALRTPPAPHLGFVIKGPQLALYFRESATSSLMARRAPLPGSLPGTTSSRTTGACGWVSHPTHW